MSLYDIDWDDWDEEEYDDYKTRGELKEKEESLKIRIDKVRRFNNRFPSPMWDTWIDDKEIELEDVKSKITELDRRIKLDELKEKKESLESSIDEVKRLYNRFSPPMWDILVGNKEEALEDVKSKIRDLELKIKLKRFE